jgi:hypothetical protein
MVNTRGMARLGMLAVGFGIATAWGHTPVASADTTTDPLPWLADLAVAAPSTPSGLDLSISFDGTQLIQEGTASAETVAGDYGLAIAFGNDASAYAGGGTGDTAIADGSGAVANSYDGTGDYALADGTYAYANAGGATGSNFDNALDIGNNDLPTTGYYDGAYAGAADLIGNDSGGTGSYDNAIDIGNNTDGATVGGNEGAFAGAGGLIGSVGNGNNDTAIQFGSESGADNGPAAVDGNYDTASESGNFTGENTGALAGFGNGDLASIVGGGDSGADAGGTYGGGELGSFDIAQVVDLFPTDGSFADAGADAADPGNYDIASAFGDDLFATTGAVGGNFLAEFLPSL